MSDVFRPSPGAVREVGNAFANLGFTIAGKLDDAEAASEYNNGMENLRRGLTQFDLSLEQNPDWRKYPEMAAQKENELWQQVDQTTKNPRAKNALQDQWQAMRDRHLETIGSLSNRVRIKTYHADGVKRLDDRENEVVAGTMTAAQADAANLSDLKSLSDAGIFDPTDAYEEAKKRRYAMQFDEAGRKIRQIARGPGGWDEAIQRVPEIVGGYSELKAPGEVDKFTTVMEHQRDYAEARKKKQDSISNDAIEKPLGEEFDSVMLNDSDPSKLKGLIEDARKKWVGPEAAARDEKWALRFAELIRAQRVDRKAAEVDNPIADGLLIDSQNDLIDPKITLDKGKDELSKREITWNQYKKVQAALSPRVKAMSLPYEGEFKTDSTMSPNVTHAMQVAQGQFRSWVANNEGAGETEMAKKAESLRKNALKGIVDQAAANSFVQWQPSQNVAAHEGRQRNPQGLTYYGKAKSGETVYKNADGQYVTQDKTGRWIYSKDGKTWQILPL